MNSFISNILDRHVHREGNVKPIVRPRFDTAIDLSDIAEYEIEPGLPEDEMLQAQSSLGRPEWKPRKDENKIDKADETVNEPKIKPSQDPLLVTGPLSVKRTGHEEKLRSTTTEVESVEHSDKETRVKKQSSILRDETSGDFRDVIEKISLLKPIYKKQTGNDARHEMISPNPTPVLDKQVNTFLTDAQGNETEANNQSTIFPLSGKRKMDNRLTGSEKKEDTRPVINVTIGSIEVKANFPAVESRTITKKEPQGLLSLEQYLEQTKSGRR